VNEFLQRNARLRTVPALILAALLFPALPAVSQEPKSIPVDKPIVVKDSKPKNKYGKFQGTVMHANIAQITVRGAENELAIRTFPLSQEAAGKMQRIIDQGGYQYGDKVTVVFDPVTQQAVKIKGKPSRPI
jgi:hypothetical protein